MEVGKLTVKAREGFGKGPSRRIRAEGLVPGICYGHNLDQPVAVVIDPRQLRASLDPVKGTNTVIEVTVEGGQGGTITAMLRESQIDALSQQLQHIDLIAIDTEKSIEVDVPLRLTGKSKGVVDGGIINQVRRHLAVFCKPTNIPTEFVVDVTDLGVGDVFHVSDITFPPGVEPAISQKLTIVTCAAPREEEAAPGAAVAIEAVGEVKPGEGEKKDEKKE